MGFRRFFIFTLLAVGLLLAAVVAIGFVPAVQTWAVRMALASRPELHGSLGAFSAGLNRAAASDLHVERGGAVLTLPSLEVDMPLASAAFGRRLAVHRLIAKGWTLDLTRVGNHPSGGAILALAFAGGPATPGPGSADEAAFRAFQGLFSGLALPFDLALEGVDLEGEVLLPSDGGRPAGRARIALTGGGLAAGREGTFDFLLALKNAEASVPVGSISARGALLVRMDTPRTFTRFEVKVDAAADGGQIARKVSVSADAAAARGADGESYILSLSRGAYQVASVEAQFPDLTHRLSGKWKLDLRDSDLVPFALGRPLPFFTAKGEGGFDSDAAFSAFHAQGGLKVVANRLGVVLADLDAAGTVTLTTDFDLAHQGDSVRVDRLTASVTEEDPVFSVHALQAFDFNLRTGELKVADPTADLMGISVQGLSLAWLRRLLPDVSVSGGNVRGEFVVRAGGGGLAVRPLAPFSAQGVAVSVAGHPLASSIDVSLFALADYAPTGWQVQLAPLSVSSGGVEILNLNARMGRLAGGNQALKVAGSWSAALAPLLAQPAAGGLGGAATGGAKGSFSGSFGATREVQGKIEIAADGLPKITGELRAEIGTDGRVAFSAPLSLVQDSRASDLTIAGTWAGGKEGRGFDVQVASAAIAFDDLRELVGALGARAGQPGTGAGAEMKGGAAPIWAGLSGRAVFAVQHVALGQVELHDVGAAVRFGPSAVELTHGRATVGAGCDVKLDGRLYFDATGDQPCGVDANVMVGNLESAPIFKAIDPDHPPTIDGKFAIVAHVTGRAANLELLPYRLGGQFQLASKAGIFRALHADVAEAIKQTPSRLSGALGTVTSLFGVKGETPDAAGKIIDKTGEAVVEITTRFSEIHYDQLDASATRDPGLNIHLTSITLIAPEERLSGTGEITYQEGVPIAGQPLALDLQLGVQGKIAALAGSVGLLKDEKDELGYTKLVNVIHLGGTLADVDQTRFREMLVQAALRKAAGTLLDRLLGK